jgi:DNA-binding SARP family transcriptional activator
MASQIEIRLLGKLEISINDERIPEIRVKKGRLLLGQLVLRGGLPISRSQVAASFWPDSYDDVARYNLRQLLGLLRKGLGELGPRLAPPGLQDLTFDISDCWIDITEFRRKIADDPQGP